MMIKIISFSILIVSSFRIYAQQIQNVKATQQGSKVLVTYDLSDQFGRPYYVKLLMSKDGGVTFGDELKFVTGDVRNTKAGMGKKILWDAAKEISYFDGDAVFRVEGALKAAPLPEPIELKCSKVELLSVKGSGSRVIVDFNVTSLMDCTSSISWRPNDKDLVCVFDNSGNQFAATSGKFGDTQLGYNKSVIKGIPVKSQLVFDNFGSDITSIPLLKIYVYSSGSCGTFNFDDASFQFRNVPISR